MTKRRFLLPHELHFIQHPEEYTFDYFKTKTLDPLTSSQALGIADEELLNRYDNIYHRNNPRFFLRMDPNGDHYNLLEEYVAKQTLSVLGETIKDTRISSSNIIPEFSEFRREFTLGLHKFTELEKIQLLKKILIKAEVSPESIEYIAKYFSIGSSFFALEFYLYLHEKKKFGEIYDKLLISESKLSDIAARPCLIYTLWDNQQEGLDAWMAAGMSGILEMATATGKTLVALAAAQYLYEKQGSLNVLVICHSRAILNQWRREAIEKLGFTSNKYLDYKYSLKYDNFNMRFETIQKVYQFPQNYATDFLIVDEVHHGAGQEFRKAFETPHRFGMGLSATIEGTERERVLEQKLGKTVYIFSLRDARERGIIPEFKLYVHKTYLDIQEDEEFRELSHSIKKLLNIINIRSRESKIIEKISNGRKSRLESLSDFFWLVERMRYREISIPDEDMKIWSQLKGMVIKRRHIIYSSSPRIHDGVRLAKTLGYSKKCVMFSMDIDTCEKMYAMLKDIPGVFRVHSKLTNNEVSQSLDLFRKAKTGILIAPKMLDEGIDVPDAEIGINIASSRTKLQLVQRMGRILRRKPGKKPEFHHYVAIPRSFVDSEDSFNYINDLAWIDDLALKMGLSIESYELNDNALEILELEKHSETIVREYFKTTGNTGIVTGDFGTIKIKNIVMSIIESARACLITSLKQMDSTLPISDKEWRNLLRRAYGRDGMVNLSSHRWLLIIADRNPQNLIKLLEMQD